MIERRKIAEDRARKNHIGAGTPERALKRVQVMNSHPEAVARSIGSNERVVEQFCSVSVVSSARCRLPVGAVVAL